MESSGQLPVVATGLGGSLAISLVSLGLVCLLAYIVLKLIGRRALFASAKGPIRVLGRCALEPRRSVYLVEAVGRCFLIGVGDGPLTTLADLGALDPEELRRLADIDSPGPGLLKVVERVFRRRPEQS